MSSTAWTLVHCRTALPISWADVAWNGLGTCPAIWGRGSNFNFAYHVMYSLPLLCCVPSLPSDLQCILMLSYQQGICPMPSASSVNLCSNVARALSSMELWRSGGCLFDLGWELGLRDRLFDLGQECGLGGHLADLCQEPDIMLELWGGDRHVDLQLKHCREDHFSGVRLELWGAGHPVCLPIMGGQWHSSFICQAAPPSEKKKKMFQVSLGF